MQDEDKRSDPNQIVPSSTQALAQRSAGLVSRGLRSLTGWDMAWVLEIGKVLTSTRFIDEILSIILKRIDEFPGISRWALLLVDEDKGELHYELTVGIDREEVITRRVKLGCGIAGYVAESGKSLIVADVGKDPLFVGKLEGQPLEKRAQSVVAVPLGFSFRPSILASAISRRPSDRVDTQIEKCVGVIELFDCVGPSGFPHSDLSALESLADFAAIAIENARYTSKVHSWSITDEQTGFYNARHLDFILDTELYRSEKYDYEFSVASISLTELNGPDDLAKSLNYFSFNRLLAEIGGKMKAYGRLIDFFFRCNQEEIICVLPQTTKENCCNAARRLHKMIRETSWLQQEGLNIRLRASIGLASFPGDARTVEDILRIADEAMHLVKDSSRDGVAAANLGFLSPL